MRRTRSRCCTPPHSNASPPRQRIGSSSYHECPGVGVKIPTLFKDDEVAWADYRK